MSRDVGSSQIKGSLRDRRADLDPDFVATIRKFAGLPDGQVHLRPPGGEERSFPAETMRQWLDGEETPAAVDFQDFLETIFDPKNPEDAEPDGDWSDE